MMVSLSEIPVYKRVSRGVVGAKFIVKSASIVNDKKSLVISISASGYLKKSKLPPVRSRHKSGVKFHSGLVDARIKRDGMDVIVITTKKNQMMEMV